MIMKSSMIEKIKQRDNSKEQHKEYNKQMQCLMNKPNKQRNL